MTTALSFIYNPSLFAVYYIRTDIDEREAGRQGNTKQNVDGIGYEMFGQVAFASNSAQVLTLEDLE